MKQVQWKFANPPLIRSFAAQTPSLSGFVIPYGDVSEARFTKQCLNLLQDWHPFCSGQYAENVIANDDIILLAFGNAIRSKVWVIPITGKVKVVDLMAFATPKVECGNELMIQDKAIIE